MSFCLSILMNNALQRKKADLERDTDVPAQKAISSQFNYSLWKQNSL